ncbi:MAG TPA: 1,2-phenylacetyl-CoA epoxidase subunit PaaD [Actinomycetota bacterium]
MTPDPVRDALPAGAATAQRVRDALAAVHDPEIPPLSIVDLGIVEDVRVSDDAVHVDLLPTFAGCPALDVIRRDVEAAVGAVAGGRDVRVGFVFAPPWTSDRITRTGRDALREYGLTPPPDAAQRRESSTAFVPVAALGRPAAGAQPSVECPFCGSRDTELESAFGPTLCRATHYCRACRNPFESFKPKAADR